MRNTITVCAVAIVMLAMIGTANATLEAVQIINMTEGPWFAGYGSDCGEFKATVAGNVPIGDYGIGDSFQTFCLEADEYVYTAGSGSNNDWVLNDATVLGGTSSEDPLDPRTAYLYTQFIEGTLSNYDFGNTSGQRVSDGVQLQKVISYIEEEISSLPSGSKAEIWFTEADNSQWTDIGNVRVLNLYDYDLNDWVYNHGYADDEYRQDILVMIPEPATICLLGLGGLLLRRRKNA